MREWRTLMPKYFELRIIHGQIGFPVVERFFRDEKMASPSPPIKSVPIQLVAYAHWPNMRRVINGQQREISWKNSEIFGEKKLR